MKVSRGFSTYKKAFSVQDINQNLIKAEYAVRGAIPMRAQQIKEEIKTTPEKHPFKDVVQLNIGNPLIFTKPPVPFLRSVISGTIWSDTLPNSSMLNPQAKDSGVVADPNIKLTEYEKDIWKLVDEYRNNVNTHQYTPAGGEMYIRRNVAQYMSKRDGIQADPNSVVLTNGASVGIKIVMDVLVDGPQDGIMIPVPQYPLYSALVTLLDATQVSYYLNEDDNWSIGYNDLDKVANEARKKHVNNKAIVVINPGNPTGNVLKREKMEEIIRFAFENDLIILSDEVYQENIYNDNHWFSFRKILLEMEPEIAENTRLVSFHSLSKGIFGECGLRGGFMDFTNFDENAMRAIMKKQNHFWPNLTGQIAVDFKSRYIARHLDSTLAASTLKTIDERYEKTFKSLQLRANQASIILNSMKNVTSNNIEGAMYAFPKLHLPGKFIKKAKQLKMKPDVLYCMDLLENTGICVVPGSGFGQQKDTYHLRTTILPQPDEHFVKVFEQFKDYNDHIMEKYSD